LFYFNFFENDLLLFVIFCASGQCISRFFCSIENQFCNFRWKKLALGEIKGFDNNWKFSNNNAVGNQKVKQAKRVNRMQMI